MLCVESYAGGKSLALNSKPSAAGERGDGRELNICVCDETRSTSQWAQRVKVRSTHWRRFVSA